MTFVAQAPFKNPIFTTEPIFSTTTSAARVPTIASGVTAARAPRWLFPYPGAKISEQEPLPLQKRFGVGSGTHGAPRGEEGPCPGHLRVTEALMSNEGAASARCPHEGTEMGAEDG